MASLLLLIACLFLGMLVSRWANPPEKLAMSLNWWVLNIALPALVLEMIPKLQFEWTLWYLVAAMWLVFGGAWLLFAFVGKSLGWSRGTIGAVVLTTGLCNSSFVGFPLIEALRGKDALKYAAIADQLGCFLAIAIGGSIVAALYSGGVMRPRMVARKVFLFPPFLALLLALAVGAAGGWPPLIDEVLTRLGGTLSPLALFSVGLQLRFRLAPERTSPLALGLVWKLALAPLLVFSLAQGLGIGGTTATIAVLQAAMAPMISAAILAEQYDLDPPLANMILGVGILLSLVTVPIWNRWV